MQNKSRHSPLPAAKFRWLSAAQTSNPLSTLAYTLVGLPAPKRLPKLLYLLAVKSILLSLLMSLALTPASNGVPAYEIHVGSYKESYRTEVRFTDSKYAPVTVLWDGDSEFPYAPMFTKSTDSRWFLLIQKVGSGDNVAWLYSVDDVGRVFCLQTSLDSMAWQFSYRVSPIKYSQLYHTGISDPKWTHRKTLIFRLSGSDSEKSGKGVILELEYDLAKNTISRQ